MMPPWNQMSPQQQQMLLSLMMNRGTGGMQPGSFAGQQMMAAPGGAQFGVNPNLGAAMGNPLVGQAQQPMLNNPALMQYLMAMRGAQQPSLAQLMAMRGTGLGL